MNSSQGKYILIVDDEEGIREILKMSLEIEGYIVKAVSNGKEALEVLKNSSDINFGLILLDLMMPIMNGWEFVEEVSKSEQFANIPILLLTAFNDRITDKRVSAVVPKPLQFKKLLSIVKDHYVSGS